MVHVVRCEHLEGRGGDRRQRRRRVPWWSRGVGSAQPGGGQRRRGRVASQGFAQPVQAGGGGLVGRGGGGGLPGEAQQRRVVGGREHGGPRGRPSVAHRRQQRVLGHQPDLAGRSRQRRLGAGHGTGERQGSSQRECRRVHALSHPYRLAERARGQHPVTRTRWIAHYKPDRRFRCRVVDQTVQAEPAAALGAHPGGRGGVGDQVERAGGEHGPGPCRGLRRELHHALGDRPGSVVRDPHVGLTGRCLAGRAPAIGRDHFQPGTVRALSHPRGDRGQHRRERGRGDHGQRLRAGGRRAADRGCGGAGQLGHPEATADQHDGQQRNQPSAVHALLNCLMTSHVSAR